MRANRLDPATATLDSSPVGPLALSCDASGVRSIHWLEPREPAHAPRGSDASREMLARLQSALDDYFRGEAGALARLPIAREFGSEFERCVWRALRAIPLGETTTYGALARAIGSPRAARAVGAAAGRNPIAIVTPCHRLIGASGALTGFAGGLAAKRWLLDHEAAVARAPIHSSVAARIRSTNAPPIHEPTGIAT